MKLRTDKMIKMDHIKKNFGDVVALSDASFTLERGEVHALVGENGAGKTTLMNILYGLVERDSGEIQLRARAVDFGGPAEAIQAGIGMVHQEFKLVPSFTVAENMILGAEPVTALGRIDVKKAERQTSDILQRFGLALESNVAVGSLGVGLRQRVEILKALYRDAEILILDEPTAVLTPQETQELFDTMRALADSGRAIIFITHKLREVLAVSDRITVMRQGQTVRTISNKDVTAEQLAEYMVGRTVSLHARKQTAQASSETLLTVAGVRARGDRGEIAVADASFKVGAGEIVCLAGVQGNGQDELTECIVGLRRPLSGTIEIYGRSSAANPRVPRQAGLIYIPVDRPGLGLSLESCVWENIVMGHHRTQFARGPFLDAQAAIGKTRELIERFEIRGAHPFTEARSLSGGNQQKVQIAREFSHAARLIVAEQPSQGVDVGTIEAIHRMLIEMRDRGRAVFVISSDLDEIFSISDRILVIYRGCIVADIRADVTSTKELGEYMGGLGGMNPDQYHNLEKRTGKQGVAYDS